MATKRFITYTIYTILAVHILLWLEGGLPFSRTALSMGCLGLNSLMLPTFPAIDLSNPVFLSSCVMVLVNHFSWFFYFTESIIASLLPPLYPRLPRIRTNREFLCNLRMAGTVYVFHLSECQRVHSSCFRFGRLCCLYIHTYPDPSKPGTRRASQDGSSRISPNREFNPSAGSRRKGGNMVKYIMSFLRRDDQMDSSFLGKPNPRKVY